MDKVAFITGSSRGIGKALAELLLEKGFRVIGISRHNQIEHANFKHLFLDLSDIQAVNNFNFEEQAEHVVLVNNAGKIGEIGPIGSIPNIDISKVMNVNTIAPQILCNKFIKRFQNKRGKYHILNISSGAGKRPITSWATYCASKAAIDLFSETIAEELEWKQRDNWFIHSCAPGVVDTQMQQQIRSTDEEQFKQVENFRAFKENNELYSPKFVAQKLYELVRLPETFPKVIISVRDF